MADRKNTIPLPILLQPIEHVCKPYKHPTQFVLKRYNDTVDERAHLCPGEIVFDRLCSRGSITRLLENHTMCVEDVVGKLYERPWSYSEGVNAGIRCRNVITSGSCSNAADTPRLDGLPRSVVETIIRVIERGARISNIVRDGELVHVKFSVGCGSFTLSCIAGNTSGDGGDSSLCRVTLTEGITVDEKTLSYVCNNSPPWIDIRRYIEDDVDEDKESDNGG